MKYVLLEIDINGTKTILNTFPNAKIIAILPPSIDILRERILKRYFLITIRGGMNESDLEERMNIAKLELTTIDEMKNLIYKQIINDNLENATEEIKSAFINLINNK